MHLDLSKFGMSSLTHIYDHQRDMITKVIGQLLEKLWNLCLDLVWGKPYKFHCRWGDLDKHKRHEKDSVRQVRSTNHIYVEPDCMEDAAIVLGSEVKPLEDLHDEMEVEVTMRSTALLKKEATNWGWGWPFLHNEVELPPTEIPLICRMGTHLIQMDVQKNVTVGRHQWSRDLLQAWLGLLKKWRVEHQLHKAPIRHEPHFHWLPAHEEETYSLSPLSIPSVLDVIQRLGEWKHCVTCGKSLLDLRHAHTYQRSTWFSLRSPPCAICNLAKSHPLHTSGQGGSCTFKSKYASILQHREKYLEDVKRGNYAHILSRLQEVLRENPVEWQHVSHILRHDSTDIPPPATEMEVPGECVFINDQCISQRGLRWGINSLDKGRQEVYDTLLRNTGRRFNRVIPNTSTYDPTMGELTHLHLDPAMILQYLRHMYGMRKDIRLMHEDNYVTMDSRNPILYTLNADNFKETICKSVTKCTSMYGHSPPPELCDSIMALINSGVQHRMQKSPEEIATLIEEQIKRDDVFKQYLATSTSHQECGRELIQCILLICGVKDKSLTLRVIQGIAKASGVWAGCQPPHHQCPPCFWHPSAMARSHP